ncbi:hypothetical protein C8R42DRAFT_588371 [Lentinula raphanica]|nr:hypothetical protein C8R42DRAFT_588371 [Lentinula raphanica]
MCYPLVLLLLSHLLVFIYSFHSLSRGVGFSVGVVASVILFKRRTFPIALSTGFGAGAAYADCDRSFNPARIPGTRIIPASPSPSGTAPDEHKHQV